MAKMVTKSTLAPRSDTRTRRQRESDGDSTALASVVTKNPTTVTASAIAMIGVISERSTLKLCRKKKLDSAKAPVEMVGMNVDQKATDRRRK